MGETRVDLLHLLEDLRDAYPASLEETIVSEIVANSLDSGASAITFACGAHDGTLTVTDNGRGMTRRDLAKYHDLAASSKAKGKAIGFAGVGIKLGLLVADNVHTETRRGKTYVATSWNLVSRHRAPWRWVAPLGLISERGTAVRLTITNRLGLLLDPSFIERTIAEYFAPLLDSGFDTILHGQYPHGVTFTVAGRALERTGAPEHSVPIVVRIGRRRTPAAAGYLFLSERALSDTNAGVAVSTLGKVIKRGWDWLGISPANAASIGGLIEVPALAQALTLNKADFIRSGTRGATFLAYRKALQQAVSAQLAALGEADAGQRRRQPRKLKRDLENVLIDLARDFPLLAALVVQRGSGRRQLNLEPSTRVTTWPSIESLVTDTHEELDTSTPEPLQPRAESSQTQSMSDPHGTDTPPTPDPGSTGAIPLPGGNGRSTPAKYGLDIQFERREDLLDLGRLVESTIWVNEAHPAYARAVASRSEDYHIALTVGMALAPLAVEPHKLHQFLTVFLARWGDTETRRKR